MFFDEPSGWYSTNDPTSKDRLRHLTSNYTSNIIANMFHFTKRPMYEVDNEGERQNVQVSF